MPQWRKLHVKATESLDINDMPDDFHRLLWVMLPLGLDREGRGLDNPAWIKAKVMPLRLDVTHEMIEHAFDWFAARSMIVRYEAEGRRFFYIPTFHKYQGGTDREAESNFPAPSEGMRPSPEPLPQQNTEAQGEITPNSGVTQEQVASGSGLEVEVDSDSEVEGDVEGDSGAEAPPPAEPAAPTPEPDVKEQLRLDKTPEGAFIFGELLKAAESTRRRAPRYYQSPQQRDAYLKVFGSLNGEFRVLTVKGIERQRVSLSGLLAWLQECAKRKNEGRGSPPAETPVQKHLRELREQEAAGGNES